MDKRLRVRDISQKSETLGHIETEKQPKFTVTFAAEQSASPCKPLNQDVKTRFETSLDDTVALSIPKPNSKDEEDALVRRFLSGMEKLFSQSDNWTFLQPLMLSVEACAKCLTCSESCHVYWASGENDLYEPLYRSEVFRRIYNNYLRPGGRFFKKWRYGEIDLNWTAVARLAELAYRCNLCRRCAQTCPIGADNGLIAHEIRKLFSQELGITARELHEQGSVLQTKVGSSTGMNAAVVKENISFIDEDTSERTGIEIKTPWDKKGADILLIHNAGEIMAWPENHGAFATLFQLAGLDWTLSSEAQDALGYDGINYGVWYDDAMFAKVAVKHAMAAKKLGAKRIVIGECGHAHKALSVIADRLLVGDLAIPRESALPIVESIVESGKLIFDPQRNNFPVTLHDPCNMVRLMGIVEPQRRILRKLCPEFREMHPHGVDNYCCGGGSGFAIMTPHNFMDFRARVTGRKKVDQVMRAFESQLQPDVHKYLCAPCSNCKGQIRDMIRYFDLWKNHGINYGGLVELVVNALVAVKPGYIEWEMH